MKQKLIVNILDNEQAAIALQEYGELTQISELVPIYSLITEKEYVPAIKSIRGIMVEENSEGSLQPVLI